MKYVMVFNDENFYVPKILNKFLARNADRISKIYTVPFFPPQAKKAQYVFASIATSGLHFLARYMGVSILQEFSPELSKAQGHPLIRQVCEDHGVEFEHIENVNGDDFLAELKSHPGTIVLSMSSQLYKKRVLEETGAKFFNFHPGLLPRNKGRFPIFWAFYNKDGEQGVTCHEINEKIDNGRTLLYHRIEQKLEDDMSSILDKVRDQAPEVIEQAMSRIESSDYQEFDHTKESFYGPTPNFSQILIFKLIILKSKFRAIFYTPEVK